MRGVFIALDIRQFVMYCVNLLSVIRSSEVSLHVSWDKSEICLYFKYVYDMEVKCITPLISSFYIGTSLNGHPSMADTCNITDKLSSPDCFSIDFRTFETPP